MVENNIIEDKTKNFFYYYCLTFPFLILLFLFIVLGTLFIRGSLQWDEKPLYGIMTGNTIQILSALDAYKIKYESYPPGKTYYGYAPNNLTTPTAFTKMYNDPYNLPKLYNTFQYLNKYLFHICGFLFLISLLVLLTFEKIYNKDFKGIKLFSSLLFSLTAIMFILSFMFRTIYPSVIEYGTGSLILLIITFFISTIIRSIYGEKISESIIGGKIYLLCSVILIIIPLLFVTTKSITLTSLLKKPEYNKTFHYYTDGKNFYNLISVGPDLEINLTSEIFKNLDLSEKMSYEDMKIQLNSYMFDPTNGSTSKGDILNFRIISKENL